MAEGDCLVCIELVTHDPLRFHVIDNKHSTLHFQPIEPLYAKVLRGAIGKNVTITMT
jgi:hypothetical protein